MNPLVLPPAPTRQMWLWPRLALAALILAVLGLMFYLRQAEQEEARLGMINDVLWLEQSLSFQLNQTEERLLALWQDRSSLDETRFAQRARFISEANPAVRGVLLLDGAQQHQLGSLIDPQAVQAIARLSVLKARPVYSAPLGDSAHIVLVYAQGRGQLMAQIDLGQMLKGQVPWWFAAKYRLALLDAQGREIASKSAVTTEKAAQSYQFAFDPPGHGLRLQLTAYRSPTGLVQKVLVGSVLLLAILVLWSAWRLRRQVRARLDAEAALGEEHALRSAMENSLAVGMRARDMQGRIIYVNPAFCRMVGYTASELIGCLPPYPYWNPDNRDEHELHHHAVLAGQAPSEGFESTVRHRAGHLVSTRVYATPLIDAQGQQRGWMSSVVDISQQKTIEAKQRVQEDQLRQTSRLIAMGEMSSTLAHELNQPLMALATYASAARRLLDQGESAILDSTLAKIAEQAQRAAEVIRRLRDFVRKRAPQPEACDLNSIVHDVLELIASDARARGIALDLQLCTPSPQLLADRVLIGQVVINLLRNAVDACAELATEHRQITLSTQLEGESAILQVCDRGPGIAAQLQGQLFTAFFSTKPTGLGIGLSICRSIVEQHQGQLSYHSPAQGGACFQMRLPIQSPGPAHELSQPHLSGR